MRGFAEVFIAAFRVGIMTFGGGYAMLPILQREIVEKRGWVSEEEIMDCYAISQCLPGIIMVNTMIFIGCKRRGRSGGVAAALGTVSPALIIISIIAAVLTNFSDIPAIEKAFAGIRVCVCVLVVDAVLKLWKKSVVDAKCLVIFLVVFVCTVITDITPILFVVLSAAAGIFIKLAEVEKHL